MISFIFLFISSYIVISSSNEGNNIKDFKYALITTSALCSYTVLGFISLLLISANYSNFPILIISSSIFIFSIILNKNCIIRLKDLIQFLDLEIKNIFLKTSLKVINKNILICSIILLTLIFISSIGPINHPDATDYHVGYPYQYFLRGGLFIDGGLHQGLLGIGDYSNLAFIQENTIWLIRTIQILLIPLIFLYFGAKNKLNIFLIVFFSCPLFIQWATIGKPLFLGDSSIALTYLIWKDNKGIFPLRLVLFCIVSAISIKISSVIISFPILTEIIISYFGKDVFNSLKKIFYILKNRLIILSILILSSILITRFYITGNFFYPLLTNIFNKNDLLINQFWFELSTYQRNGLFPLNIFLPTSFSEITNNAGINIFLIFIFFIVYKIKKFKFILMEGTLNIPILQTLLLIIFCQGRGDYYACPILLFTFYGDRLDNFFKVKVLKLTFITALYFQVICSLFILTISIYQSLITFFNFEYGMQLTAYGYESAKEINSNIGNNLHFIGRNTRLFYPKNYIDNDLMKRCTLENNSQDHCIKKYEITKIISYPNYLLNKESFNCTLKKSTVAKRNPFSRSKNLIEVCNLNHYSK